MKRDTIAKMLIAFAFFGVPVIAILTYLLWGVTWKDVWRFIGGLAMCALMVGLLGLGYMAGRGDERSAEATRRASSRFRGG